MQLYLTSQLAEHEFSLESLDGELDNIYRDGKPFPDIGWFLADDYYFGKVAKDLWPENVPDLLDIFDANKEYLEIIMTGATSIGKTFMTCIAMAYMIAQLGHYVNPHRWIGASSTSPIIFINMSITAAKARDIIYTRVKNMCDSSPYFREVFKRDTRIADSLVWRKDLANEGYRTTDKIRLGPSIVFKYGTGDSLSALGDDIYGGAGDELNFFRIVQKSTKARGNEAYDPAQNLYETIGRRMRGRFSTGGKSFGKFFLLSSAQYPEDFIERRIEEAQEEEAIGKTVKVIRRSTWEAKKGVFIQGKQAFSDKTFRVEIGTAQRGSRILDTYDRNSGEIKQIITEGVAGKIIYPPVELWDDFRRDVDGAVRDFGGEVTRAISPFFPDTSIIWESIRRGSELGLVHPWSSEDTDFRDGSYLVVERLFEKHQEKWRLKRHSGTPRFFHLDLGLTGDPAALCVIHVCGWKRIFIGAGSEDRPIYEIDLILRVNPPIGGQVDFAQMRNILFNLRFYGMYLKFGSFDQFQSADSIQILNSQGIATERVADNIAHFLVLKDTMFEERLLMYDYQPLAIELTRLESRGDKVDHSPGGHDDMSQALAHAIYNTFVNAAHASPETMDSRLPKIEHRVAPLPLGVRRIDAEKEMMLDMGGRKIVRR